MPARARKRKPRRRKSASRKKARRRRPATRSRVDPLSSDEDFVLDSDGDESSSGSTDEEGNDDDKDIEEEEEEEESEDSEENSRNEVRNSDANLGFFPRRRRQPTRARNGAVNATSISDGTGGHVNPTPGVHRRRHRRQDSSDEDFDVDLESVLENSIIANEDVVVSRPMTRALDSCQVSDVGEGEQGNALSDSAEHETRDKPGILDTLQPGRSLQTRISQEGHANSVSRGSTVISGGKIDSRKGKEKVLEAEESTAKVANEETTAAVCGICWTEMGVVERGKLDSCDHYFCFGCIMEWAKVESRCPMCKQRFTTIARSGTGITKRTRAIRIPLRNQVYIPPEDSDLPHEDPFADVVCMECLGTGDEGLLLLCDRCDSAAHTFCVGLGRSVPRGDWYCRDCQALTGGMSSSGDCGVELEELVWDVDDEEGDDDDDDEYEGRQSLLRSLVASTEPRSRRRGQVRAQRRLASASSPPLPQRNRRGRLWQRLQRRRRGRHIAAPRLSQAARALLSSTASEHNNQASSAPEALQNGSARTVPQQRRLHERINEMRNSWGRIQNGDLHFDALRSGATPPMPPAVPSNWNGAVSRAGERELTQAGVTANSNIASLAPTPSITPPVSGDNRVVETLRRPDSSINGIKDVERAWQMMGHAQNLGIGSSKSHQQKLGASSSSVFGRAKPPTEITASCPTSSPILARKNLEIPTSPPPRNCKTGSHKQETTPVQVLSNLQHYEIPLQQAPMPVAPLASTAEYRKEDLPSPSKSMQTLDWKNTGNLASTQGFKPELSKTGKQLERKDAGITGRTNAGMTGNRDVSAARENIVAGSVSSPPHEGLKVHLTELVKKQTWPVYITERLDKEQFKRIARAAVHSLLALCDPSNKSVNLSCVHFEDRGTDPFIKCCNKCFDVHVEKAVKDAKKKVVPS